MQLFRRRLRTAVIAWLLFQVVSVSALVPRDCCEAHRPASAAAAPDVAASPYCPMRSQGRNCPMHAEAGSAATGAHAPHAHHAAPDAATDHGAAAHADHPPAPRSADRDHCSLDGSCRAPMTALAVILSNHGIITDPVLLPSNDGRTPVAATGAEHLVSRLTPPDSPPPRA